MSVSLAFLSTTVAVAVLFLVVNVIFWSISYVKRVIYPSVAPEVWRDMGTVEGQRRARQLGALTTIGSSIFFVPFVWMLGPSFAGARVVVLAVIFWAAFSLPGACYNSIYYRIGTRMLCWQAFAELIRIMLGFVLVSWMLTVLGVW
ncbi:MAG: hypothetical protein ABIG71_02150 [Candidatus Uhrbacteria bacterium]